MADKTPEQIKKEQEEAAKKQQEQQQAEQKRQEEQRRQQQTKPHASTGKISTYSATKGQGLPTEDPRGDRMFTKEEIKQFAGDLVPGELGWVNLDEEGTPNGAAKREIPDTDEVVARVYVPPKVALDEVVTPSGAPITKFMNPELTFWDEGMRTRNPVPREDRVKGAQYKVPPGGGVINQPVTT